MPREKSAMSEMDVDGTEAELAKLQRQLKIIERERKSYSLQASEQIRKQEQEIEMLLKEQEELHCKRKACQSSSRRKQDTKDTQSLRAMLLQEDMLQEEMEKDKQVHKELEKEIANMESKIAELRKRKVNANDRQKSDTLQRQQAKLDRASTKLTEQLNINRQISDDLQTLEIERVRFHQLKSRLEKELYDIRKKIGELVSLSTSAYDARLEAQSKMTMMKEKAEKDVTQYNAEMKELERVIAHECSLKEFMNTKNRERSGQDDGQETGHRKMSELKAQKRLDSGEESLDTLKELFEKTLAVTGEANLDQLVIRFIQAEDRNFALFNFVNEQNKEANALRDQISQIQTEIEQYAEAGLQQERDHHSLLRALEEKRMEIECRAEEYENRASIISNILDHVKTGVNSIFSKIECERSVIEDKLGCSSGISDNNIMSYLGLLEQRTSVLLTLQAFLDCKDQEKGYNPKDPAKSLLGQNPELLQQNISIQPTIDSLEYEAQESPVTDEEERPLSRGELHRKVLEKVLQRERSGRQDADKASKI